MEDYKKENVILEERISKLEAEQEILQTSVSQNAETMQHFDNEIIQLKENNDNVESKNNALPVDLQDTFTETSAIAGGKVGRPRSHVTQGIGTESRFENGNGNHRAPTNTKKLQKLCLRLQHTDEEMEECSFLEAEKAQKKGDTDLINGQSAGGDMEKSTESHRMETLKSVFKGMTMLQNCKTASSYIQTNSEEIVYAWMEVLSFLTQSKSLK